MVHVSIVGAGEACDGVHEEEDVFAGFDEAFGAFDGEFGDAAVVACAFVVRAGVDFGTWEGAAEFGDFLGAFVDEEDHEVDGFVVFFPDGLGHVEEEGGFTGARWGDDESALAAADGCHDVDDAGGVAVGCGFEGDSFGGVDGLEFLEVWEFRGFFRGHAVDGADFDELGAARAFLVEAVDPLADAEVVAADDFRGDEDVFAGLFEVSGLESEEAEAFWGEFEHAEDFGFGAAEWSDAAVVEVGGAVRAVWTIWTVRALALVIGLALAVAVAVEVATLIVVVAGVVVSALIVVVARIVISALVAAAFAFFAAAFAACFALSLIVVVGLGLALVLRGAVLVVLFLGGL